MLKISSKMSIGPQLPPNLQKLKESREENGSKSMMNIGPSMPPEFQNSGSRIGPIGPSIPPEFLEKLQNSVEEDEDFLPEEDSEESEENVSSSYGPALPPDLIPSSNSAEDLDENADDVGPLLECPETTEENYEERLLKFRYEKAMEESATKNKRESWMTELPEGMRQYGLQARGFKQRYESEKAREESRTAWTEKNPGQLHQNLQRKMMSP